MSLVKYISRVMVLSEIAFILCSFATVTTGFSPGSTALNLILQFAGNARQCIDVAAYDFTSQPLVQALFPLCRGGVAVRLVADEKKSQDRWSLVSALAYAGVQVRVNGMYNSTINLLSLTEVRLKRRHLITRHRLKTR